MIYSPHPPYEILQNKLLDFTTLQRLRRFARYWDLVGNSGNFLESTTLLCQTDKSAFAAFMRWSDWLYDNVGRRHSIALDRLAQQLFQYLTEECALDRAKVAETLWRDWQKAGRREKPAFLAAYIPEAETPAPRAKSETPKRQARHMGLSQIPP
jgi:hypothetical protein